MKARVSIYEISSSKIWNFLKIKIKFKILYRLNIQMRNEEWKKLETTPEMFGKRSTKQGG